MHGTICMDDNNTHLETVLFARQADRLGYFNALLFLLFIIYVYGVCNLWMSVYYLYINSPCVQKIVGLVEMDTDIQFNLSESNQIIRLFSSQRLAVALDPQVGVVAELFGYTDLLPKFASYSLLLIPWFRGHETYIFVFYKI